MLALGVVVIMLGVTVAFAQERQPVEFFQMFHLRSTPVLVTLLVALVAAGVVGSHGDVHGIQGDSAGSASADDRPDLQQAFDDWIAQQGACTFTISGGNQTVRVRPMMLISAEGGGIRAAYWTAAALEQIAGAGKGCGARSTLLSTGASGGALGLTVARFDESPLAGVKAISGDDALAVGSAAMFTRDTLATLGIRKFERATHRDGTEDWRDRAALMELSWQRSEEADARLIGNEGSFLRPPGDATAKPGSTDGPDEDRLSRVAVG